MSKESLEQFVQQEFLQPGDTQNQLKATDSFDDFVNLMVHLGKELHYSFTAEEVQAAIHEELDRQKKKIQEIADQAKAKMESLPPGVKEKKQALKQAEADKQKAEIDDAIHHHWQDYSLVNTSIANLKGLRGEHVNVLPVY